MSAKVYLTSSSDNVVAAYNSAASVHGMLVLTYDSLKVKFSVTDATYTYSTLIIAEMDANDTLTATTTSGTEAAFISLVGGSMYFDFENLPTF